MRHLPNGFFRNILPSNCVAVTHLRVLFNDPGESGESDRSGDARESGKGLEFH